LTDADGKEYIDGLSGLWNVLAGHGRKELAEVAAGQMETLAYCSGYALLGICGEFKSTRH
jgi:adenosylmethionine-8-amino-7-oxononanoate aminotransferase